MSETETETETETESNGEGELLTTDETVVNEPRRWWPVILVVIALLVAFASLGWSYQLSQSLISVQQQNKSSAASLSEVQETDRSRINRVNAGLQNQERLLKEVQKAQQDVVGQLGNLETELRKKSGKQQKDPDEWVLAEAVYLITAASQRLLLAADVNSALVALQTADVRLRDLNRPDLIPVRQQLASEINALRAVPPVDIAGLALYLADLIDRADTLPLRGAKSLSAESEDVAVASAEMDLTTMEGWKDNLQNIWVDVKSLLVIRKQTVADAVLFDPERHYFLYQNLRLELASARLSVLRRDTANFHTSIDTINGWLSEFFESGEAAVANILEANNKMKGVDLAPPLPELSASLKLLKTYVQKQQEAQS